MPLNNKSNSHTFKVCIAKTYSPEIQSVMRKSCFRCLLLSSASNLLQDCACWVAGPFIWRQSRSHPPLEGPPTCCEYVLKQHIRKTFWWGCSGKDVTRLIGHPYEDVMDSAFRNPGKIIIVCLKKKNYVFYYWLYPTLDKNTEKRNQYISYKHTIY